MTSTSERQHLIDLIREACCSGARVKSACYEVGISLRTYRRWYRDGKIQEDQRALADRPVPFNKLSDEERQVIVDLSITREYASLPPSQIVPSLLDQGVYLASESSFYRILKAHNLLHI